MGITQKWAALQTLEESCTWRRVAEGVMGLNRGPAPPPGRCVDAGGAFQQGTRAGLELGRVPGEESAGSGVAEGRAVTAQSPAGSGASLPGGGGCVLRGWVRPAQGGDRLAPGGAPRSLGG